MTSVVIWPARITSVNTLAINQITLAPMAFKKRGGSAAKAHSKSDVESVHQGQPAGKDPGNARFFGLRVRNAERHRRYDNLREFGSCNDGRVFTVVQSLRRIIPGNPGALRERVIGWHRSTRLRVGGFRGRFYLRGSPHVRLCISAKCDA